MLEDSGALSARASFFPTAATFLEGGGFGALSDSEPSLLLADEMTSEPRCT
jgi:hypothetical protein